MARVAATQRGLVTTAQLRAAGASEAAVSRRLAAGRLHRVHRGVYLVGHPVAPPLARELAALLACGPLAVISHRSAAFLWQILAPAQGPVHVTVPGRRRRARPGLQPHAGTLEPHEATTHHGLRVTTPARTLGRPSAPSWPRPPSSAPRTKHRCSA